MAGARKSNEPLQRPELGSSRAERDCSSTGGRADMRDGTNLKACCGAAFVTDNSAAAARVGASHALLNNARRGCRLPSVEISF